MWDGDLGGRTQRLVRFERGSPVRVVDSRTTCVCALAIQISRNQSADSLLLWWSKYPDVYNVTVVDTNAPAVLYCTHLSTQQEDASRSPLDTKMERREETRRYRRPSSSRSEKVGHSTSLRFLFLGGDTHSTVRTEHQCVCRTGW